MGLETDRRRGFGSPLWSTLMRPIAYLHVNDENKHRWAVDDRLALRRAIGFSITAAVAATLLLEVPALLGTSSQTLASHARLALYAIPQTFALAVPTGLTLGIFCGLGRWRVSRRLSTEVLALALACCLASLATVEWIVPTTERAFRVSVTGQGTVWEAANEHELTLNELARQIESERNVGRVNNAQSLRVYYHNRWALSCASFVLALFALAVVRRWHGDQFSLAVGGCAACLAYYSLLVAGTVAGRHGILPALVGAWLPNVVFAVVTAALIKAGIERSGKTLVSVR